MNLLLHITTYQSTDNKYKARFNLIEFDGNSANITPYYTENLSDTEAEAFELARGSAARIVLENYPEGTKLFLAKGNPEEKAE